MVNRKYGLQRTKVLDIKVAESPYAGTIETRPTVSGSRQSTLVLESGGRFIEVNMNIRYRVLEMKYICGLRFHKTRHSDLKWHHLVYPLL